MVGSGFKSAKIVSRSLEVISSKYLYVLSLAAEACSNYLNLAR